MTEAAKFMRLSKAAWAVWGEVKALGFDGSGPTLADTASNQLRWAADNLEEMAAKTALRNLNQPTAEAP